MTWEQINRQRIRHIRFGESFFYMMYSEFRSHLSDAMNRAQTIEEIQGIAERFQPPVDIEEYFVNYYVRTGMAFAKRSYTTLKAATGQIERKDVNDDFRENLWRIKMIKFVQEKCANNISLLYWNHVKDIKAITVKATAQALDKGWGAEKLANEILKMSTDKDKWKALRIARTEAVTAGNLGAHEGAVDATENGITLEKIWLSSGHPGPSGFMREDHELMNEEVVDMEESFILPDGTQMLYPHDPNAPAEHVINCRCGQAYRPKGGGLTEQILAGDFSGVDALL